MPTILRIWLSSVSAALLAHGFAIVPLRTSALGSDSRSRVRFEREAAVQGISLINLPLRAFSTVDSNWGPRSTPISLARFLAHSPTLRESR